MELTIEEREVMMVRKEALVVKKEALVVQKEAELEYEKEWLAHELAVMSSRFKVDDSVIHLNVGGEFFSTFKSTLCKYEKSMIAAMFSGRHPYTKDMTSNGRYFIDRPAKPFAAILDFLRTDEIVFPRDKTELKLLMRELDYYGLSDVFPTIFPNSIILTKPTEDALMCLILFKNIPWQCTYQATRATYNHDQFQEALKHDGATIVFLKARGEHILGSYDPPESVYSKTQNTAFQPHNSLPDANRPLMFSLTNPQDKPTLFQGKRSDCKADANLFIWKDRLCCTTTGTFFTGFENFIVESMEVWKKKK